MVSANTQKKLTALAGAIHKLPAKDRHFAAGLIDSTVAKGETAGRMEWIDKLLLQAEQGTPTATSAAVGSFVKVFALFNLAKTTLKKPKIRLLMASGKTLVLAVATPTSQYAGQISITDGQPYGYNAYYGRVDENGTWVQTAKAADHAEEITGLLTKLGERPAHMASEYGRLTGRCMFCNLQLTDAQSTAAGYGPKCAKNYGLSDDRLEAIPTLDVAKAGEEA